jgi:hypothetical protein
MKKALFVIVVVILVFLSACAPNIGDFAQVKNDGTRVVEDWNYSASIDKPIACTLNAGDQVEVLEYSTISLGSSWTESVVLIKHDGCEGWVFPKDIE